MVVAGAAVVALEIPHEVDEVGRRHLLVRFEREGDPGELREPAPPGRGDDRQAEVAKAGGCWRRSLTQTSGGGGALLSAAAD